MRSNLRSTDFACSVLGLVLASCASHPPAASPPPATGSAAPAADTASPATPAAAEPAAKPSLESQREPFVKSCMEKVPARDYCDCAFEQFKDVFKDADLSKPLAKDDPHVATLQQQTITACGSKLSEEQIKGGFMTGCRGDDPHKDAYCSCAWTTLRKSLKPADFVGSSLEGERYEKPKKAVVKTCKGKYPAEAAKAEFVKGCSSNDKATPSMCECLWKKLRTKFSVEDVVVGTVDLSTVPGVKDCK
jgi:hypothetical protein